MASYHTDVLIIGAGIAGLWLHNRLNEQGYHATLIEKNTIGGAQTLSAQGIIHGGSKYALNGLLSNAAVAISEMPQRWHACLAGTGDVDLTQATILTDHQLLWSKNQLAAKMTSFFASKAVRSKMTPVTASERPALFQHPKFKGALYQLNEPVLDIPSVLNCLVTPWQHRIIQCAPNTTFNWQQSNNDIASLTIDKLTITAQQIVLTAGEGNQDLLDSLNIDTPKMQCRPLQMVLCKSQDKNQPLPKLYAHSLAAGTKPLATITSHTTKHGETVWYIGGDIAETGVERTEAAQIIAAQTLLSDILPWVNLPKLDWATHHVNRAEPEQSEGSRPDTAFVHSHHNLHITWPTKLALAPDLSDTVIKQLTQAGLTATQQPDIPSPLPIKMGEPLWEFAFT